MRKWIVVAVVVALVAVGVVVFVASSGGSSSAKPILITDTAQARDLRDEVSVSGTLERAEQRTVNAVSTASATNAAASASSTVSAVHLKDGAALVPGDAILAVDGRDAVTSPGAFPFFRRLDVGAQGADVLQLETILLAAGFSPGPLDQRYTEQTRFALGQWQAAHRYPGASPSTSQAVNVSLQQGAGYQLGAQTSAGLTIGAPAVRSAAATAKTSIMSAVARLQSDVGVTAGPTLTIVATSTVVNKGSATTFVVNADSTSHPAINFSVSLSGTAGPDDVIAPAGPFTLPVNAASTTIQILTKQNTLVEPNKTLVVSLASDPSYIVGVPGSATITIVSNTVPQLTITGSTTVLPGQSATVTVTADQAPVQDTQVNFTVGGTAVADNDYVAFAPSVMLYAGQTTAQLTITTKTSSVVKPDRRIVIGLAPAAAYQVGPINTATITIQGATGSAATPTVTISTTSLRVTAGQPAQFSIGLDRALSQGLQVTVRFGGDAVVGSDYNPPSGLLTVPPGQTSLAVVVPTLNNGLVQPDTTLVVSLVPDPTYVLGAPDSASTLILAPTLPKVSIVGGPAAVGLGGGVVFTVIADQPPIKDTSVQYTVTGTAQQGKDIQPVTGSVVLVAGATSVDIPILTLNTNVFFVPTDIIVTTGPGRLGQVFVKEGQVVAPGTPLFTLTEPNIAVTLQASAADRTKLKVGQSATVQVQGSATSAPGVITHLDDFPTTDPATKKQTFKGTAQVQGDLGAADGTPVTVKVVVQERLGALTVPIAAVRQNGSGQDVVRVIDLRSGTTREVKVETGLSEGSYIEIKSGLGPRDVVVVELNQAKKG